MVKRYQREKIALARKSQSQNLALNPPQGSDNEYAF